MTPKEQLIAWLNDAYSTEKALIPVLENHAKDAKDYPEIQQRDLQHAEETRRQAELVEGCIKQLGGTVSNVKSAIGTVTGTIQSVATGPFRDELIKNCLSDYAAEHFEIASYKALIAAAEHIGENGIVPTLREILREEEEMARWLDERLPMVTREVLGKTSGAAAG